jgi:hypothetical protein
MASELKEVGQTQKKISNQCHKYTTLTTSSNSHAHEKMEESCIPFLAELTVDWYHLLLMSLSIPIIWGEVLLQSQPCSFMAVMIKYRYTVHVYSHMLYHTICSALFFCGNALLFSIKQHFSAYTHH